MDNKQYNALFSFIWNIANDVLVHAFEKGDYKKIILPFMVLRRIDVLLEPTKAAVLEKKEFCDSHHLADYTPFLTQVTGYPFYNTSAFTMKTLKNEIDPIEAFYEKEVKPYDAEAQFGEPIIGYELSFTKYFYKPVQLRTLDAIMEDIRAIERDTDGLLDEIMK